MYLTAGVSCCAPFFCFKIFTILKQDFYFSTVNEIPEPIVLHASNIIRLDIFRGSIANVKLFSYSSLIGLFNSAL
jgi:ABC-type polysaccharide transport system permease subunit